MEGSAVTQEAREESDCKHYWKIESPNGPTSFGTCKLCGLRSEFKNSIPGSGWDRASPQAKRLRQARQAARQTGSKA